MSTTTTEAPAAASAAGPAPAPPAGSFTHRQILVILSGLMLGMFLAALDQNIVSTSIRTIADDLHGLNLQAWATTAYLITATISTPLYGKLSDLYGRKPFFLAAITIFVVGSILCTISTSMYELAAFRALQGLGAGGLMSLALTIIGDIVPPRERARYQGFFLAVFGTSSVVGPVLGGFLAGQTSILGFDGWRWVFLINVPIGLVALVVVFKVLNLPHTRREHRIDFPGAIALAVTLVPFLVIAEQGREWGWGSVSAIVCYVIGAVGLVAFVLAERAYGDDALLPLRLFRNSVFSLTSIIAIITGIGLFGGIALVPQYLQIVTGSSPTEAGLEMLPLVGGLMISSIVAGQLTARTGRYKIFPIIGLALMTIGLALFHFLLHFDTPYGLIAVLMLVFGLGVGQCMQTLVVAVQNAVPAKDMGVATASATFFRQMGGTLGVAVFLSILFSTVGDKISTAFAQVAPTPAFQAAVVDPAVRANPANAVALTPGGAAQVVQDSSVLQRMDTRLAEPFFVGFSNAMDLVFLVAACVVAVGFVLVLFMREIPLRNQSGIQARDAEARQVGPGESGPAPVALDIPASSSSVAASAVSGPSELADAPRGDAPRDEPARPPEPERARDADRPDVGDDARVGGSAPTDEPTGTEEHVTSDDAWGHGRHELIDPPTHPIALPEGATRHGREHDEGRIERADRGAVARPVDGPGGDGHAGPPTGSNGVVAPGPGGPGHPATGPQGAYPVPAAGSAPAPSSPAPSGPGGESDEVSGRLLSGGRPVADVPVTLHDLEGAVVARTVSERDGRFVLRPRPSGTSVLIVSSPGHRPFARLVRMTGPAELLDVELESSGDVTGEVRDAAGTLVAGATVTVTDVAGRVRAVRTTGEDGGWEASDLDPGAYTVAVLAPGRAPFADSLSVGAPDAGPVHHRATVAVARHTLTGRLRSSTGRPVGEALVVVVGADGGVVSSVVTDPEGRFHLEDLPAGTAMLTASGFAPESREVTVTGGRVADDVVTLTVTPPRPAGSPSDPPTDPSQPVPPNGAPTNGTGTNGTGTNGTPTNGTPTNGTPANGTPTPADGDAPTPPEGNGTVRPANGSQPWSPAWSTPAR